MMPSRGMGAVAPSKMPKGKKTARRDDTDFTQFKKGGDTMAKMNPFMAMIAKKKEAGKMPAKKMASGGMTSMGKVKTAAPSRDGVAIKGKTKGKIV